MRILLRVLPVILLLTIALMVNVSASSAARSDIEKPVFQQYPAVAADNVTSQGATPPTASENATGLFGMSFFSIFAPWVWWTIGGVIGILLIMIIVLVAVPSRRKQGAGATKGAPGMRGMPGMQDMQGMQGPQGPMPMPTPGPGQFNAPIGTTMPPQAPGAFPMQEQYQPPGAFTPPGQYPGQGPMAPAYPQYARRPIFSVSNLTITPNQVKSGNPITISAIVANNGSDAGTYSVVLRINGMVENIMDIMLSPGASQATTFTVDKEDGGEYYAEVDGLSGIFVIIPLVPASFTISNLVIAPERAKQGESIIISAMVTNNGELSGAYNATLKLKGAVESTEEINLSPGESKKVSFKIAKTTPGFYNVELDGLAGRFVVEMEWQQG
jgi:hypothetical protein